MTWKTEIPAWMAGIGTHEVKINPVEESKIEKSPKMRAVSFTLTEEAIEALERASKKACKGKSAFIRDYLESLQ